MLAYTLVASTINYDRVNSSSNMDDSDIINHLGNCRSLGIIRNQENENGMSQDSIAKYAYTENWNGIL